MMTCLLFAVGTADVVATAFAALSFLFLVLLILYLVLTRVGTANTTRLVEGKCPLSGQNLSKKVLKNDWQTRKKYAGYHSELVSKKIDENTVVTDFANTRLYKDQQIRGFSQERWEEFNQGYSLIYTQTTRMETRKNPDPEQLDPVEYIVEYYTYEVESYGKLGKLDRIRLKKICKKACFENSFEA